MADSDFKSRNPVLNREFNDPARYATFGTQTADAATLQQQYELPATSTGGDRMTIQDVVIKTAILFVILVADGRRRLERSSPATTRCSSGARCSSGSAWASPTRSSATSARRWSCSTRSSRACSSAASAGSTTSAGTESTRSTTRPDCPVTTSSARPSLGTLVAFGVMLALYASGKLRATPRFQKMMMVAMVSYLGIAVVSLISAFFGVGEGWGFYGVGGLGLLLCVAGVGLASFSLVLDFDAIEKGDGLRRSPSASRGGVVRPARHAHLALPRAAAPAGDPAAELTPLARQSKAPADSAGAFVVQGVRCGGERSAGPTGGALHVALVDDGLGIAVRQAVLVLQPVDPFSRDGSARGRLPRPCTTL